LQLVCWQQLVRWQQLLRSQQPVWQPHELHPWLQPHELHPWLQPLWHPLEQQDVTQQESQQQLRRQHRRQPAEAESAHNSDTVNNTASDITIRRMTKTSSKQGSNKPR
jgi:hypothetical protein